jgi:hypothetical protein
MRVEQALGRRVQEVQRIETRSAWGAHVRLRVRIDGGGAPLLLRVKIVSAETFGTAEVDYYLRDFTGLPDAPLLRCRHGPRTPPTTTCCSTT